MSKRAVVFCCFALLFEVISHLKGEAIEMNEKENRVLFQTGRTTGKKKLLIRKKLVLIKCV